MTENGNELLCLALGCCRKNGTGSRIKDCNRDIRHSNNVPSITRKSHESSSATIRQKKTIDVRIGCLKNSETFELSKNNWQKKVRKVNQKLSHPANVA